MFIYIILISLLLLDSLSSSTLTKTEINQNHTIDKIKKPTLARSKKLSLIRFNRKSTEVISSEQKSIENVNCVDRQNEELLTTKDLNNLCLTNTIQIENHVIPFSSSNNGLSFISVFIEISKNKMLLIFFSLI